MRDEMDDLLDEGMDDGLGERIHDAYEHVSLSPEAEERILGALLAAQAARQEGEASAPETVPSPAPAEILPGPVSRRKSPLRFVLPAAACLVLAFLAGRAVMGGKSPQAAYEAASMVQEAPAEMDSMDGGVAEEAPELEYAAEDKAAGATEDLADAEMEESAEDVSAAHVMLDDGTMYDLVVEDGALVEVEAALAGEPVGAGEAWDLDGTSMGVCEVLTPVDGSGLAGYWLVRPDGMDVCYLADLAS